ncbi:MAG TPA: hypothetical protein G4O00_13030 [Thermoflexia bacterium]|jgi:hypothetical protein|nr:hypothetical protein [Thermoflexia bacterium]
MIEQVGIDERRRGFFWGPNELIRQWAPLIGLDGIGLLISYDVWCDRREGSATEGYAFPTRDQEATFYGIRKETLGVLTSILEATGWLRVERVRRPVGRGRGGGGVVYRQKNLYRLLDRDWELTPDDVLNVLRLADEDPRVFKRIRHLFRPDFQPIDGKDNPWKVILPQLRQHPLWQKLAARERAHAANIRRRFDHQREDPQENRSSISRTAGSEEESNRSSILRTTGSEEESNRQSIPVTAGSNRSSILRTAGQPVVTGRDGKHDDADDEADEEDEDEVFRLFASLAGHDTYEPSTRDVSALRALRAEGYTTAEILAGIERAVAGARARGTIPRQFTYCVPAVRDVPPQRRMPAANPAPAVGRAAVPVAAVLPGFSAVPSRAAAPAAAPSDSQASPRATGRALPELPAASPDPLASTVNALARFAEGRGLALDEATLRDLARLAQDFDEVAAEHGSSGLDWVQRALRKVDSRVAQPARYVRAILEDWEQEACSTLRQAASLPLPEQETAAGEPSKEQEVLWRRALEALRLEMTASTFNTWFARSRLLDLRREDEGTVWVVGVHSQYAREWLEARLLPVLERVLTQLIPETTGVEFVVPEEGGMDDA